MMELRSCDFRLSYFHHYAWMKFSKVVLNGFPVA